MPSDLLSRTLVEIARDLRERRLTARELIEAAIARHERFGERLHAYSLWAPEQARAVADAADAAFAAGVSVGPLQGLPVSIKDLFAAAGYPCFAGSSRRLPAEPWERDGPLVATLRRQLGVIMGKTHMVEFAFGGTGQNSHHGAPYNPWDAMAHRSVGGSSSGAGVSLLEGSALLAFGSDTAGSVRIPACMTGNAGLKVTLGRWSAEGVVPLSFTFDTPGLLARSVSDIAYGFAALDPADIDPVSFIAQAGTRDLTGVRIGVGDPFLWQRLRPGDCRDRAGSRRYSRPRRRRRMRFHLAGSGSGIWRVSRWRTQRDRTAQFSRPRTAGVARSARPGDSAGYAQRRKPQRARVPGPCFAPQ